MSGAVNSRTYAYVACVFVVVFYAGNILVGKALNDLPPITIAFFRVAIACLLLLPFGWRSAWRERSVFRQHAGPLLFVTLTGVTFFNTFIYAALNFTSATNVSVLEAVVPVVTALLSAWLLRERLRAVQWSGVGLSLAGALFVVLGGAGAQAIASVNPGDVIMIGAILSWALYSIGVKRYLHLFPESGVLLVMTGLSVAVLLPLMLAEWLLVGVPNMLEWSPWPGLLYLGIFPSVVALFLYNRAVGTLGASQAAIFLNFLPVLTMLGAFLFLGESIHLPQILGAGLVIAGVLLATRTARTVSPDPVATAASVGRE